jgi:hypothetical protein
MSTPALTLHAQERIAALLAMVAGFVDAYGYLTYHTYVSFMSGKPIRKYAGVDEQQRLAVPALGVLDLGARDHRGFDRLAICCHVGPPPIKLGFGSL